MGEMKESVEQVMEMLKLTSKEQPDSMRYFKEFMASVLKEGKLDTKTKKLIAVWYRNNSQMQILHSNTRRKGT